MTFNFNLKLYIKGPNKTIFRTKSTNQDQAQMGGGGLAKNQHQSVANSMPEIEHNLRLEQKIFPPNLPIANLGLQQIDSPFGPHCDEMARFKI